MRDTLTRSIGTVTILCVVVTETDTVDFFICGLVDGWKIADEALVVVADLVEANLVSVLIGDLDELGCITILFEIDAVVITI